jgi:hypothetical protein
MKRAVTLEVAKCPYVNREPKLHAHQRLIVDRNLAVDFLTPMTASAPLGVMTRSPKTDLARTSRSGHGLGAARARTGASRATGRRRRVTSISCPPSTRAMTLLGFCWSSLQA